MKKELKYKNKNTIKMDKTAKIKMKTRGKYERIKTKNR